MFERRKKPESKNVPHTFLRALFWGNILLNFIGGIDLCDEKLGHALEDAAFPDLVIA
jgi:hypothetical protein